jgi:hypothetical protein
MFRHQMCHPQGTYFVTFLNYLSAISALAKINKVFKRVELSSVIEWLLLQEVCLVAVYTVCKKYGIY